MLLEESKMRVVNNAMDFGKKVITKGVSKAITEVVKLVQDIYYIANGTVKSYDFYNNW